jgi:hypothetical protein
MMPGMKLLAICLVAVAGSVLVACGDDEDDGVTVPTVTVEVAPTEGATTTTPTAPPEDGTATDPSDASPAPPAGEDAPGKPKGTGGKQGADKPDLPKCSDVGEGPAKCRRKDGTVRVPEPL